MDISKREVKKKIRRKLMGKSISIVGLGKLGTPIAVSWASRGFNVIGVDVDENKVLNINKGISPVFEPEVGRLLKYYKKNIKATSSMELAIKNTDFTIIIVATPSEIGGKFSLKYILPACQEIGKCLKEKKDFHSIIVSSTVVPGDMNTIKNQLEVSSGKKCGKDFGLGYVPEFVALGSVVKNYLNPEFVLIGTSDEKSKREIFSLFRHFHKDNEPIIKEMNFINTEMAKISLNVYLTMKISFANTLAEMCEKLPGGNVDEVTAAIGIDSRVGAKFLRGGLGFGGTCFPRDNEAFSYVARSIGSQSLLSDAADWVNDKQVERLLKIILEHYSYNGKVGIVGISFKSGTNVLEKSQALEIAQRLASRGISVNVYDPLGESIDWDEVLQSNIYRCFSLESCVGDADVVLISQKNFSFKNIQLSMFKRDSTVIDCWRILDKKIFENQNKVKYIQIGVYDEG